MSEETGFTTMAGAKAEGEAPEIGFGMLGYAFMGKAHSNALKTLPYMMYPPVAIPNSGFLAVSRLVVLGQAQWRIDGDDLVAFEALHGLLEIPCYEPAPGARQRRFPQHEPA